MERILDENEKIRRAEELYYRRNNISGHLANKDKKNVKGVLKTKILLNLLVLFNISVIVFMIQNKDFIFTEEFLEVLSNYNNQISIKITEYVGNIWKNNIVENNENQNQVIENAENFDINNEAVDTAETLNNSAATQENQVTDENSKIESSSISEMELDIQNLKAAYSFSKPLDGGTISSEFGVRESEYQNVTGYHTGIDIAKETGSIIKASMGGIVDLVSDEGDYGKHIKIRCNNVTTLYAHCSKIYVKEGQIVAEGQEIAEVGSTGNSTGSHLHFEIRVDDRYVNPSRIIEF